MKDEKMIREEVKPNTTRDYTIFFIIALVAIFFRSYCFVGIIGSDDLYYNFEALSILNGTFTFHDIVTGRFGLVFPIVFFLKILGMNEISSILFNYLCSLGTIILAYFFGKKMFDKKTGIISALIMATLPVDIVFSTQTLPDFPSAFFMGLSIFLFLSAEEAKNIKKRFILFIFCGFSLGISYSIKESVFFLLILLVIYTFYKVFIKKDSIWPYLFIVIGFLVIFIPEAVYYYFNTGELLFRIKSAQSWPGHMFSGNFGGLIKRLFFDFWYAILFSFSMFGFLFWFTAIAIIYMFKRKMSKAYKIIAWLIGLFILYNFGSCRLNSYNPLILIWKGLVSYKSFSPFVLPAVLIAAYFFKDMSDNKTINSKRKYFIFNLKFAGYFLLIFYLISSIYFLMDSHFSNSYPYRCFSHHNERIIRDFLCDKEKNGPSINKIYTDSRTKWVLSYFLYHQPNFSINDYNKPINEMKNSYIIINWPRINFLFKYRGMRPPDFVYNIPDDWIVIREIKKKDVKDSAIIYFIPDSA